MQRFLARAPRSPRVVLTLRLNRSLQTSDGRLVSTAVATPKGLRPADEVVPKLGVRPGLAALRIGDVATYDRPIEHLAGQLDHVPFSLPLRKRDARYGLVLCFALGACDLARLASELVRVAHPAGRIWVTVWKKDLLRDDAPSWEEVQRAMLPTGWVDNKVLSLGEQAYATQYVLRKERR